MNGIQCMPCSSRIISERLPEILKEKRCSFLKPLLYSQTILFSVVKVYGQNKIYTPFVNVFVLFIEETKLIFCPNMP